MRRDSWENATMDYTLTAHILKAIRLSKCRKEGRGEGGAEAAAEAAAEALASANAEFG